MWILGGGDFSVFFSDVWWSIDGVKWIKAANGLGIDCGIGHKSAVFKDSIYVAGVVSPLNNAKSGKKNNKISFTIDGVNWETAVEDAKFNMSAIDSMFVNDDQIWVVGSGCAGKSNNLFSEMWSSADGSNWSQQKLKTNLTVRCLSVAAVVNNVICFVGGN